MEELPTPAYDVIVPWHYIVTETFFAKAFVRLTMISLYPPWRLYIYWLYVPLLKETPYVIAKESYREGNWLEMMQFYKVEIDLES